MKVKLELELKVDVCVAKMDSGMPKRCVSIETRRLYTTQPSIEIKLDADPHKK